MSDERAIPLTCDHCGAVLTSAMQTSIGWFCNDLCFTQAMQRNAVEADGASDAPNLPPTPEEWAALKAENARLSERVEVLEALDHSILELSAENAKLRRVAEAAQAIVNGPGDEIITESIDWNIGRKRVNEMQDMWGNQLSELQASLEALKQ